MRKLALQLGIIGAMALSLAGAGMVAAANAADATITHFTPELISDIVKELGATDVTIQTGGSGTKYVQHKVEGYTFLFSLLACKPGEPGCLGLGLVKAFSPDEGTTFDLATVNSFNSKYAFAQAHVFEKNIYLTRYTISDGGISRDNIRSNIQTFWAMPVRLAEHFASNLVSQAPSVMRPVVYTPPGAQYLPAVEQQIGVEALRGMPKDRLRLR